MIIMFSVALVLVQIAQSDAPLHNLHAEQHKYEQCSILLVGMNNYAMHNNHIMHIFVLLWLIISQCKEFRYTVDIKLPGLGIF